MYIDKIEVKNFRLLKDVGLFLEQKTTVIVGRNNSGKTSLAELFRRLLVESSPMFRLEDFSLGVHMDFWNAFAAMQSGKPEAEIRAMLPTIEVSINIVYDKDALDLGVLSDFIIDLNPDCVIALAVVRYQLDEGKLKPFFAAIELDPKKELADQQLEFFQAMKELIPKHYKCKLEAVDPNDPANRRVLELSKLKSLVQGDLITAHRGLDDTTHKDNDSLGKILGILFSTADSESAAQADRETVSNLKAAVKEVQGTIGESFNDQLQNLLPAFHLFGYPDLDPKLRTETQLDVEALLKNHTKIRYSGVNGVHLPEGYNGLGTRNLIFILFKLLEAFKSFKAKPTAPAVQVIFIEEPEAHLHPQMQEVFIAKLAEIATLFARTYNNNEPWPVQFVVSTHSSHMANKAAFSATRYFLATVDAKTGSTFATKIKDLKKDFGDKNKEDNAFLHKYMTLTRCDLLFADKVVLIEGTSERILLPKILEKVDVTLPLEKKLGSRYLAILEVGGAYAHIFFRLLDFLEIPSLVITDLDSVNSKKDGNACKVSEGDGTSNACIKSWFEKGETAPAQLIEKTPEEKTKGFRRLAFQIPETAKGACGRSFEDAFMLANADHFKLDPANLEQSAWEQAQKEKKSDFALTHAINVTEWVVPRYISEGLMWLAETPKRPAVAELPPGTDVVTAEVSIPKEVPVV